MCGVVGYVGPAGRDVMFRGLGGVLHRGQSATGISSLDASIGNIIRTAKVHGQTPLLLDDDTFQDMGGQIWIGHTRYPTQGTDTKMNIQPHYKASTRGKVAVASNGDVVNMGALEQMLSKDAYKIYTDNDAEMIAAVVMWCVIEKRMDLPEAIVQAMRLVRGSFSALLISEWDETLYAFRDTHGIRPLYFAQISDSRGIYYTVASETVAIYAMLEYMDLNDPFGDVRIDQLREVMPGEVLAITPRGFRSYIYEGPTESRLCLMERLYLMRPDSLFDLEQRTSIASFRHALGAAAYDQHGIKPDVFGCIPRSGRYGSLGYAAAAGVPYGEPVTQNRDLSAADQMTRDFIGKRGRLEKFRVIGDLIRGRHLGVGDDSVVEGITSRRIVRILQANGVDQLDYFSFAPQYLHPCYYGLHTKDRHTLVAACSGSDREIARWVGCPVHYLDIDRIYAIPGMDRDHFCDACFTGNYPIPLDDVI